MKISTRARYALKLMLDISHQSKQDEPISLRDIAERTGLSRRYLDQLVISLRNARLIRGLSGRKGGYLMIKDPSEIKLSEIVEAAIGPISLTECVKYPEICKISDSCICRLVYALMTKRLASVLEEVTLADLSDEKWINAVTKELEAEPYSYKITDKKTKSSSKISHFNLKP